MYIFIHVYLYVNRYTDIDIHEYVYIAQMAL